MELNANYYWASTAPNGIPYRMIGEGTLQVTDEGLVATGYAMRSGGKAVLIFLAYCIGALATGMTLAMLLPHELSVIGMAVGLFGAVGIYWRFHRKKGP